MKTGTVMRIASGICVTLSLLVGTARAAEQPSDQPKTGDSDHPTTTTREKRTVQQIMQDIGKASAPLQQSLSSPAAILDEAKRKEAAPKVIPALKGILGYVRELREADATQGKMIADQMEPQMQMLLGVFGDQETLDSLKAAAKGADKDKAVKAKATLMTVDWLQANKDSKAQEKILKDAEKLAHGNASDQALTNQLFQMGQMGASSPDLGIKMQEVAASMDNDAARHLKEEVEAGKKLHSLEHKPLVLSGTRNDGSQFTTDDWKGKVILVDFWASWCGPCRAELPRVKKAYADFHDKGLEVLGVSCDYKAEDLKKFLDENKDMPWPQLFDSNKPGWHPLATEYGIRGIPTMFLIDKNGVVRTVEARENFEELIPKMLKEK